MQRLDDPFFPITPALSSGLLPRDNGHALYFETAGNPDGIPLVLCHGGPGGSSSAAHRRFVDPERWYVIQFDQRGCGRSIPSGELAHNTLAHTLDDMEALRLHLGISRWAVAGGSWGSTVALAYAQAHPACCTGLLLQATWLCRRRDTQWWFQGVETLFPELWSSLASVVPEAERGDLRRAYCERILNGCRAEADDLAIRLYGYEEGFMHLDAPVTPLDPERGRSYGRIFAHYAAHDFFLEDNALLAGAERLTALPVMLLTGRYDCCTPPENAWSLAERLPAATLRIVPGAGHYPTEPAMGRALAEAGNEFLARISGY